MRGLLTKDFALLLERKQTILIFVAVCLVMSFSTDGSFVVGYLSFLSVIISMSTISYDDADNGMLFLMTLPVDKKTYTYSKYLLGSIFCGAAWILSIILLTITNTVKGSSLVLADLIIGSLFFLPLCIMIIDLMIPMQLKFGAEKSRIVLLVIFGGITALGVGIGKTSIAEDKIESWVNTMNNIPTYVFAIAMLTLAAAATLISIYCSKRIMQKKVF